MQPSEVSAVIVTRGDKPAAVQKIIMELPFTDIVVWDNSKEENMMVLGRYFGMMRAKNRIVYVQDDDCIVPLDTIVMLLEGYESGKIIASMPSNHGEYSDSVLVGWGAIFHRHLPWEAFVKYGRRYDLEYFRETCDVIFTALTPFIRVEGHHDNFEFAYDDNRMYNQSDHNIIREKILNQARMVRDNPPF